MKNIINIQNVVKTFKDFKAINDLSLKVEKIDNKLVFNFQNNGNMKKLISTVDEVLEHVHVSLGVME